MNRKEAQEIATILYQRIVLIDKSQLSDLYKKEALVAVRTVAEDLFVQCVWTHLHAIEPAHWYAACLEGAPLFPSRDEEETL